MKKSILIIFVVGSLSVAQMPKAQYRLKMQTLSKEFCKRDTRRTLCDRVILKYPKTDILKDNISKILRYEIQKAKESYEQNNPKENLVDIEPSDSIGGIDWEERLEIKLFDYAYSFVTVSLFNYSYTGGAHPNSSLGLKTYKSDTKEPLKLKDIISYDNNSKFMHIAKRYYYISEGLLPNEPLTNADWFDNQFTLSKNFAITDTGILFSYSPYEIKPYADGYTYFVLPYYALKGIINKDSPIYNIVKHSFKKPIKIEKKINLYNNIGEMEISINSLKENRLKLDVSLELYQDYRDIWLSVGFPQFRRARYVNSIGFEYFNNLQEYPAESRIYNNTTKRAFNSFYLMEEAHRHYYRAYNKLSASWIINPPKSLDVLCMEFRVTARDRRVKNLTEDVNNAFLDQQGFTSHRVCIDL